MDSDPRIEQSNHRTTHTLFYGILLLSVIVILAYFFISAPTDSQSHANREPTILHIYSGESLAKITTELESKHVVRSHTVLKILLTLFSADTQIERGDYKFDTKENALTVAWRLSRGDHKVERVKVTLREGITVEEIAEILSDKSIAFRKDMFISDPRVHEGYVFPDTYFFFPLTTTDEIITELTNNFKKHIQKIEIDIKNSGHTQNEILTMASILEEEAHGVDDNKVISGILWKRISKGMLLQVDADRTTYAIKGLPSRPIANPGMESLSAALHPEDSPYLFYLHGKDGRVHYATTYKEHMANINRYLK